MDDSQSGGGSHHQPPHKRASGSASGANDSHRDISKDMKQAFNGLNAALGFKKAGGH
jgi:dihydroxyacetone kinase